MSEVMDTVNANLKKQAKIAAKKQLYFSLATMLASQMGHLKNQSIASGAILQASEAEDGAEDVPPELVKAMAIEQLYSMSVLYQIVLSLRNYKNSFGEFPEFVRFFEKQIPAGLNLEKWMDLIVELYVKADQTLGRGKKGIFKGKTIKESVIFGTKFHEHCEQIKLKGEV